MTDKLKKLISYCKCCLDIHINEHRGDYESAEVALNRMFKYDVSEDDIPIKMKKKMIELDTIIKIICYSDTPVGFFRVYHYDLDLALDEMVESIENDRG